MDLFEKQIETYGFSKKVIRLARDMAIQKTQRPHPKYITAILKKWYDQGLRTYEDVKAHIRSQKAIVREGDTEGDDE